MEELVIFMTAAGKFPIPSTNAYIGQYPDFYKRQRDVLAAHGGFKFVEAFCPASAAIWALLSFSRPSLYFIA